MKYGKTNEKLINNLLVAASIPGENKMDRITGTNKLKLKITAIIDMDTRNIIFM